MAEITAALIKSLERTGIGMMECKKRLNLHRMRYRSCYWRTSKKGLSSQKADREVFEGGLRIITDADTAYIISVSCETDFLANSDKFKAMLDVVCSIFKKWWKLTRWSSKTYWVKLFTWNGENLQIKQYEIMKGWVVAAYVHSNGKLAAVTVAQVGWDEVKLKQVAMHVTAANQNISLQMKYLKK